VSALDFVAIALTFVLAGLVKGVTGMGLPTVAMGLLGSLMAPASAAALLVLPSFVTNIWQMLDGAHLAALARRMWPMMVCVVIGTLAASPLLTGENNVLATLGLGLVLALYAGFSLLARPILVASRMERWLSPVIGLVTGAVTGATGVFVMPAVPYLQALRLERDELVQALGLSFTVSTVALALGLALQGAFQASAIGVSALAIVPALLGMRIGQFLRNRMSQAVFRRWFFICLLLLGLHIALRAM
jgi:uncharacterized membrane protein YfcA